MSDYIEIEPGNANEIMVSNGGEPFWAIITLDNEIIYKRPVIEAKEKP